MVIMKMAIMGAGSLGIILGALLTKKGCEVNLVGRDPVKMDALNKNGAKVIGSLEFTQPVRAILNKEMGEKEYDIIFHLTKTTQNDKALGYCKKALKSDGVMVCMQNGLPEHDVAEIIGIEKVIGCVMGWGATYIEPGVSKLTTEPDHMIFEIGEIDGKITDRLLAVEKILNNAGKVEKHTNLMGMRWTKLTANSCFSGMSAVVAGTFGDVCDNPKAIRCAAYILRESMDIAKAAKIIPVDFQGYDLRKLTFNTDKELEQKLPDILEMIKPHRKIRTGMLYDIEAGREPEIDTYNGLFVKWGKRYNVPTPVNSQVVDIVKGIYNGKYKIDPSNVNIIKLPELTDMS